MFVRSFAAATSSLNTRPTHKRTNALPHLEIIGTIGRWLPAPRRTDNSRMNTILLPSWLTIPTRKVGLIACNVILCLLSGWLGILHGYFPARRIRTLIVCAVLACLIWLGHRWFRTWVMRAFLVLALILGALGTLSGLDIQASNQAIDDEWQEPHVQRTHQLSTQCPVSGLLPCRTRIVMVRQEGLYYQITDDCSIPYFFCFLSMKVGQE